VEPIIAVTAALLRHQMPELVLRPGISVTARVASLGENHGVIVLAGIPITAQLPPGIVAGETIKLHVQEVTQDRVVLRLDQPPPAALAAGGWAPSSPRVAVQEPPRRRAQGGGEDGASVALSFRSPQLGRIDLRIDLAARALDVGVAALPGRPYEAADAGAERLRTALESAVGLHSTVRVIPRREPLDVYA
jgi:hypothetical protein